MHKSRNLKRPSLTFLLLSMMVVSATQIISPFSLHSHASPDATISVYYPTTPIEANPGESFVIEVNIADVADLFSCGIRIGFDKNILEATDVEEGPFIRDQTTSPLGTYFSYTIDDDFASADCITLGRYPGVGGSGNLFTVAFTVKDGGESTLHLYSTLLLDSTGSQIPHTTSDANFRTTTPVASFTFSPDTLHRPIVGENVTFDASACYDPDGGIIASYSWDFGDGTNGTGVIATHAYDEPSVYVPDTPYEVTLLIVDEEGLNNTASLEIDVQYHDVAVIEVSPQEEVPTHGIAAIDVTVLNNGSHRDTFNVTAYYGSTPIRSVLPPDIDDTVKDLPPGDNKTITFLWNTYINQSNLDPSIAGIGNWTDPENAYTSNDLHSKASSNDTGQEFRGYEFETTGWSTVSKVEVGIEVRTDVGGDDQLNMTVYNGKIWNEGVIHTITSTTDTFFWVDVTDSHTWQPSVMNQTRVKLEYIQVGANATPIYVDWLPVRITPLQPRDVEPGTYVIWANAYLVDFINPSEFRPGEEENTADNTLFGDPIVVTMNATHDMVVGNVEVAPTDLSVGRTPAIEVEIENRGNTQETFDVVVYANSTEIANQTAIRLFANASTTLRFRWFEATNTTVEGVYNVTVYVPAVLNETMDAQMNNVLTLNVTIRLLPTPFFTFSPSEPSMNEAVTFDGSPSYAPGDPGGQITDYIWDFGDGTNATGATAAHTYTIPGVYNVELMVIDDLDLSHTQAEALTIKRLSSTITATATPETVPIGFNTTVSGSITPARASVTVTINYTLVEETAWMTATNVLTNQAGQYSFEWKPTEPGVYEVKAFWQGDVLTLPAESSLLSVNVAIQDVAVLEITSSKTAATKGETLTIEVELSNKGTATESFNVSIYYNNTLLTKVVTGPLAAGANGTISLPWDTQNVVVVEGIYIIKAVAEPLPAETYVADNVRINGVLIQEPPESPLGIFHYTTIGMAAVVAALVIYLVKLKRSK